MLLENTDTDDNNHIPTYIFTISPSLMGMSVSLKRGEKWQTTWFTEMHVGKAIPNKTITQITKLLKRQTVNEVYKQNRNKYILLAPSDKGFEDLQWRQTSLSSAFCLNSSTVLRSEVPRT